MAVNLYPCDGNWNRIDVLILDSISILILSWNKKREIEKVVWFILLTCNNQIDLTLNIILFQAQNALDRSIVDLFHILNVNTANTLFQTLAKIFETWHFRFIFVGQSEWALARYFEPRERKKITKQENKFKAWNRVSILIRVNIFFGDYDFLSKKK